ATRDAIHGELEQRRIFVLVERRGFAGRARHDDRARAAFDLIVDQTAAGVEVRRVIARAERRGQSNDAAGESQGGNSMTCEWNDVTCSPGQGKVLWGAGGRERRGSTGFEES